jgi:hypothetical protein
LGKPETVSAVTQDKPRAAHDANTPDGMFGRLLMVVFPGLITVKPA